MSDKKHFYNPQDRLLNKISFVSHSCPIEQIGINPKKVFYIPVKDKSGLGKDKYMRVVENGSLHKQLLASGVVLKRCWVVEEL